MHGMDYQGKERKEKGGEKRSRKGEQMSVRLGIKY